MSTISKAEFTSSLVEKNMSKKHVSKRSMKEHGKPWRAKRCSWLVESKVNVRAERPKGSLSNPNYTLEATESHCSLLKKKEWGHLHKECSLIRSCTFYRFSLPGAKCIPKITSRKISPRNNWWFEDACFLSSLRQSCIVLLAPTRGTHCLAWTIYLPINHLAAS